VTSTRKRASTNGRAQVNIAQQLRARGTTVDLGGSPVKIVIDWSAVEALETEWGSLKAWGTELQKRQDGRMFRCVGDGIAACVRDLPVPARSLMDLGRLAEYAEALMAALVESGLWKLDEEGAEGNAEGATTAPSPGSSSSTPLSSASASAQSSSGA
jgi:hypothetical protein